MSNHIYSIYMNLEKVTDIEHGYIVECVCTRVKLLCAILYLEMCFADYRET